jgi:hypothetical protein
VKEEDRPTVARLAYEGQVDELLGLVTPDEIAKAWVRYHVVDKAERENDWWAIELWMTTGWWAHEDLVRAGLLKLIDEAPDAFLGHVGAGPLENFVVDDEPRLLWVEEQAAASERFRRTLATVWIWNLPDAVFERMERAAGVPLPRPRE